MQFFKFWRYSYTIPAKYQHYNLDHYHPDFFVIRKFIKYIYVFKREKPERNIVRMSINYVRHGEIWYLRKLLLNIPTYFLHDYKYYNSILYNTFQESAIARGYVNDNTAALHCFNESKQFLTPNQLRSLFFNMTYEG